MSAIQITQFNYIKVYKSFMKIFDFEYHLKLMSFDYQD